MRKRIAILCLSGAAVAVIAAAGPRLTAAQGRPPRPEGPRPEGPRPEGSRPEGSRPGPGYDPVARLLAFDKNSDGKVTREELTDERLKAYFDRTDTNRDGALTREEIQAAGAEGERGTYRAGPRPEGREGGDRRPGPAFQGPPGGGFGPGAPMGPGFGGPGGPRFGRGFGAPPQPGQVLPEPLQQRLGLTESQKKKLAEIQRDVDSRLKKLLTEEQRKQFDEMKQGPRFGPQGFGPGGPMGFGRGGGFGPGGPQGFGPGGPMGFGRGGGGFGPGGPQGPRPGGPAAPRQFPGQGPDDHGYSDGFAPRPEPRRDAPRPESRERGDARPEARREGGERGGSPVDHLHRALQGLRLSDEQKARLEELLSGARRKLEELRAAGDRADSRAQFEKVMEELRPKVAAVLTEEQRARLHEVLSREGGPRGDGPLGYLHRQLAQLDLSADQQSRIREILTGLHPKLEEAMAAGTDRETAMRRVRELVEQARERVLAVLTPEQKARAQSRPARPE
jgi:hypothetical protein